MRLEVHAFGDRVENRLQRTLGDECGVKLLQRAGSSVARVLEERFAGFFALRVEFFEIFNSHKCLAANLEASGRMFHVQLQRDGANGLEIGGDIVARGAVAAGRADRELPVFVANGDRHAVDFRFEDVFDLLVGQKLADAGVKLPQFLDAVGVVEGHHGHGVADALEFLQRLAAGALGGRIGRDQVGELGFQPL